MEKQFKLIKEYPGSPKLGTIKDINWFCSKFYPFDCPEFWQEIKEVKLEVPIGTRFKTNFGIFKINKVEDNCALIQWDTPNYMVTRINIEIVNLAFKDGTWTIYKEKTPIFLDELGNEVFEGDIYYVVQKETFHLLTDCTHTLSNIPSWWRFKNKVDAEKYISDNKPTFSRKQVLNALEWGKYEYYRSIASTEWFRVVKEKLGL